MKLLTCILLLASPVAAMAEWKNESEAGLVINYGNSRSQSIHGKHDTAYGWSANTLNLKGNYLRSTSAGVLSTKRWDVLLKYERALSDRFSLFASQGIESDRFAGYHHRYNTDIGPKYYLRKEEKKWEWFAEAGYRFTRENPMNGPDVSSQKGRLYTESTWFWSESGSSKVWLEYVPNFSKSKDWLFNAEVSSSAAINSLLAFKVAYLLKYDNTPNTGASKNTDGVVTTALVAKY